MEFAATMTGTDLPKVLLLLNEKKLNGNLKLSNENLISSIWIQDGEVIYARHSNSMGLSEGLQILNALSQEDLMEIRKDKSSAVLDDSQLDHILVEKGFVRSKMITYVRAFQIAETLFRILEEEKIGYEFDQGDLKNLGRFDLLPKSSRWIDEIEQYAYDWVKLSQKIGVPKQVFKQKPLKLTTVDLTEEEEKIYKMVDGKRQRREIILWSMNSYFKAHKILFSLFQKGVIDIVEKQKFRASVFTSKQVVEKLKSVRELPGIKNAFLVDRTGKMIVRAQESADDDDLVSTMASIFATTVEDFEKNLPTSETDIGKIEQILVERKNGNKTLLMVAGMVMLATQAEENADWGLIRLASKRALTAIRQVIFA